MAIMAIANVSQAPRVRLATRETREIQNPMAATRRENTGLGSIISQKNTIAADPAIDPAMLYSWASPATGVPLALMLSPNVEPVSLWATRAKRPVEELTRAASRTTLAAKITRFRVIAVEYTVK